MVIRADLNNALAWAEGKRLDASGKSSPEPHAKTLAAAVRAFQFRWAKMAQRRRELEERIEECEVLFELQHTRTVEAGRLWQKAHNKPLTHPDLGELVRWLMVKAGFKPKNTGLGKSDPKLRREWLKKRRSK